LVKAGKSVIAVRVFDHFMGGGFGGSVGRLLGRRVELLRGRKPVLQARNRSPFADDAEKPLMRSLISGCCFSWKNEYYAPIALGQSSSRKSRWLPLSRVKASPRQRPRPSTLGFAVIGSGIVPSAT